MGRLGGGGLPGVEVAHPHDEGPFAMDKGGGITQTWECHADPRRASLGSCLRGVCFRAKSSVVEKQIHCESMENRLCEIE